MAISAAMQCQKLQMLLPLLSLQFLFVAIAVPHTSSQAISTIDICTSQSSCKGCIQAHQSCAWCAQKNSLSTAGRCHSMTQAYRKCTTHDVIAPDNEVLAYEDLALSDMVAIKPQRVILRMRPHTSATLSVNTRKRKYPVDLFVQFGLSFNSTDAEAVRVALTKTLLTELATMDIDLHVGVGYFGDESTTGQYGYGRYWPLGTPNREFEVRLKKAKTAQNCCSSKEWMNAFLQTMICDASSEIGWREDSIQLLVMVTDIPLTFVDGVDVQSTASDPEDGHGSCQLKSTSSTGELTYDKDIVQNYPSIAAISKLAEDKDIHLVFVVSPERVMQYERLCHRVARCVVTSLDNKLADVLALIKNEYLKPAKFIKLSGSSHPQLRFTLFSSCGNQDWQKTDKCRGVQPGSEVEWKIKVDLGAAEPYYPEFFISTSDFEQHMSAMSGRLEIIDGCERGQDSLATSERNNLEAIINPQESKNNSQPSITRFPPASPWPLWAQLTLALGAPGVVGIVVYGCCIKSSTTSKELQKATKCPYRRYPINGNNNVFFWFCLVPRNLVTQTPQSALDLGGLPQQFNSSARIDSHISWALRRSPE